MKNITLSTLVLALSPALVATAAPQSFRIEVNNHSSYNCRIANIDKPADTDLQLYSDSELDLWPGEYSTLWYSKAQNKGLFSLKVECRGSFLYSFFPDTSTVRSTTLYIQGGNGLFTYSEPEVWIDDTTGLDAYKDQFSWEKDGKKLTEIRLFITDLNTSNLSNDFVSYNNTSIDVLEIEEDDK